MTPELMMVLATPAFALAEDSKPTRSSGDADTAEATPARVSDARDADRIAALEGGRGT